MVLRNDRAMQIGEATGTGKCNRYWQMQLTKCAVKDIYRNILSKRRSTENPHVHEFNATCRLVVGVKHIENNNKSKAKGSF